MTGPPAQELPPGACGPSERTLLAETSGEDLLAASPQARTLVFRQPGGVRIHDTASGRDTLTAGSILGFDAEGRRALVLGPTAGATQGLLEVDAAQGTVREPVEGARASQEREGLLRLSTPDGRTWLYTQGSGALLPVVSTPTARPVVNFSPDTRWVLSGDAGGFMLWELATGAHWRTPPAEDAGLLPDGAGAVYVDAQQRAWGWTPSKAPVALGQHAPATRFRSLAFEQAPVTGEVLFVGTDGQATLWNPRTGAVRGVGSEVVSGVISHSGTHLALLQRGSSGGFAVSTQTLPSGPAKMLWQGEQPYQLTFNREGTRLAFVVRIDRGGPPGGEAIYYAATLWDVEANWQLELRPATLSGSPTSLSLSFREDAELLHASVWAASDWMYSARTGTFLFNTAHGVTSQEKSDSTWGPDGVFYGQYNAYPEPPAVGLYAWDPRTGVETQLGSGTRSVCHWGARLLLLSEMKRYNDFSPGRLRMWDPATSTLETLASEVNFATCGTARQLVVYYRDWTRSSYDGTTALPERGTLHVADPATGCHQVLATQVERSLNLEDGIVYQAEGRVWRASLP